MTFAIPQISAWIISLSTQWFLLKNHNHSRWLYPTRKTLPAQLLAASHSCSSNGRDRSTSWFTESCWSSSLHTSCCHSSTDRFSPPPREGRFLLQRNCCTCWGEPHCVLTTGCGWQRGDRRECLQVACSTKGGNVNHEWRRDFISNGLNLARTRHWQDWPRSAQCSSVSCCEGAARKRGKLFILPIVRTRSKEQSLEQ